MSGLSIEGARVSYPGAGGPTTAVDGVSLDVAAGEVVALLGPSGCGKSSLLRAVAGLEPLAAGTVRWAGEDLAPVPVHRRGFGLMFQDGQLFGHRDVAGNIAFGLQMAHVPAVRRRERVDALLELVGLAGYGRRAITTLSGGEQQRVALARALAPRPRLLLLDEPLSALDRALRERLASDLHDILRRTETTALYVTHDHDEAFTVAHRVAVMRAGRLVQVGSPAQLWAAPADADVARFLGYRVVPRGGRDLALGPQALVVADGGDAAPARASAPGDLPGDLPGARTLTGRVTGVGFSRGRTTVTVDLPDWGEQRGVADGVRDVAVGDEVRLRVDPSGVVWL